VVAAGVLEAPAAAVLLVEELLLLPHHATASTHPPIAASAAMLSCRCTSSVPSCVAIEKRQWASCDVHCAR
jgi:hypothetical protein